jgi:hypothetical protein
MSTPTKLRPGNSELTKLKTLWRTLAEDARSFWQELFVSPECTQAQVREKLFARLKINLRFDKQLNAFRDWELEQRRLDLEEERQQEDERRLMEEFGTDQMDVVREKVLKKSYARALTDGDWSGARKTVVQDLNIQKLSLDSRKLALLEKKAAAFDAAKDVIESKLSPDEQKKRLKEILK